MDEEILTIGLINLAAGVLALAIAYLYCLPHAEISSERVAMSAELGLAADG